jgi:protein ImuB
VEPLLFGFRRLALELCGFLAGRQQGATRLQLTLEHEDHPPTRVRLELSMPSRDAAHLGVLARERLSRLALPGPVEAFGLALEESMQLAPRSLSFLAEPGSGAESRAALVERLRARLGREAVHGLALVPEHRPELAHRAAEPGTPAARPHDAPRPLWLLAEPRPLAAGPQGPRLDGPLELLEGPERIESGWWDDGDVRRDYFVARATTQARLWVYREIGADAAERWYLQGLFA